MAQRRILVADDSEEIREMLAMILEREGYAVECAGDGRAALDAVRAARPDLIITDLSMPVMTGLEMLARLRSDFAPPLPPVIVSSGFDQAESSAMRLGAACFIPKPIDPDRFLEIVAQVIERHRPDGAAIAGESRYAHEARTRAAAAAARMVEAAGPQLQPVAARWVQRIADYFGTAPAVIAVVDGDRLKVVAASADCLVPAGAAFSGDLLFSTGVLAAGSSLVVSDARVLRPIYGRRAEELGLGFLVAVPLIFDAVPVGTLGLVGGEPRSFPAEDLMILESVGRYGSAELGRGPRLGEHLGLFPAALFDSVLSVELGLLHRERGGVDLAFVDVDPEALRSDVALDLATRGGARFGLCQRDTATLAIYKRHCDPWVAAHTLSLTLAQLSDAGWLHAAGWISVVDEELPPVPLEIILQLAAGALEQGRGAPSAPVQRVMLGRQLVPSSPEL